MARQEILDRIQKYVDPFRITKAKGFRLKDFDPGDTRGLKLDKGEAAELLQRGTEWLAEEQNVLFIEGNGTDDDDLRSAGLERARGLVAASDDDSDKETGRV